jgi:hypothetical protein
LGLLGEEMKIKYNQLREIISLVFKNSKIKALLQEKGVTTLFELDFKDMIVVLADSEVDIDMLQILTGKNAENIDALEAIEEISDFINFIMVNYPRLIPLVADMGFLKVVQKEDDK